MPRLPPPPAGLKPIAMYIKTADEFDRRDQAVAFYCRAYAAKVGIEKYRDASTTPWLMQLLDVIETDKKTLAGNPAMTSELGQQAVWKIAIKVFKMADDIDRAGRADKKTAQTFYTAMILFEVLQYFDALNVEESEKHKYAKFKAAYILRCIREGVTPVAGPMDADGNPLEEPADIEQDDMALPAAAGASGGYGDMPPATSAGGDMYQPPVPQQQQQPPPQQQQQQFQPPPQMQQPQQPQQPYSGGYSNYQLPPQQPPQQQQQQQYPPMQPQQPPPQQPQPSPYASYSSYSAAPQSRPQAPAAPIQFSGTSFTPRENVSIHDNDEAAKFCKFAISALQYNDTKTAVENCLKALKLLTQ